MDGENTPFRKSCVECPWDVWIPCDPGAQCDVVSSRTPMQAFDYFLPVLFALSLTTLPVSKLHLCPYSWPFFHPESSELGPRRVGAEDLFRFCMKDSSHNAASLRLICRCSAGLSNWWECFGSVVILTEITPGNVSNNRAHRFYPCLCPWTVSIWAVDAIHLVPPAFFFPGSYCREKFSGTYLSVWEKKHTVFSLTLSSVPEENRNMSF